MKLSKVRLLGMSVLFLSVMATSAFAYEYFWKTDPKTVTGGMVLLTYPTPTMGIGVYWDVTCTQPVTVIDYGEIIHPAAETRITKTLYIRNEGDVWQKTFWNTTLTEFFNVWTQNQYDPSGNINGSYISAGSVLTTYYWIVLPAYATVGTYNWTLNLWAEHWY